MWKKYFKQPLESDEVGVYIFDNNHRIMFNWLSGSKSIDKQKIIDKLNGSNNEKLDYTFSKSECGQRILIGDEKFLLVRGWGYLTGHGVVAQKLDQETAIKVQDSLVDWAIDTLNS